jgi:hypothetical protein
LGSHEAGMQTAVWNTSRGFFDGSIGIWKYIKLCCCFLLFFKILLFCSEYQVLWLICFLYHEFFPCWKVGVVLQTEGMRHILAGESGVSLWLRWQLQSR